MTQEIKRIPIAEFRKLGFVQEINRRILHPCGLALEVILEANGDETLGGVWDYRDDPEGMAYQDGMIDRKKYRSVEDLWYSKAHYRMENLGYVTQPVPEEEWLPVKDD